MSQLSAWKMAGATFVLCAATSIGAQAQTFNTLVTFDGSNGSQPYYGSLVQGANGLLYGTTYVGGTEGLGTVFSVTSDGDLTTQYSFLMQSDCSDGKSPVGALVLARDGNYYGTTYGGGDDLTCNAPTGCGTIFRMTPEGTLTTLHVFQGTDGFLPYDGLAQSPSGLLYGTTYYGGASGQGTVFEIAPTSGTLTTLHSFSSTDGAFPTSALVQGTDGDFYGTTTGGGNLTCFPPVGCGTVFRITPGGKLATLHSFALNDGANPVGGLILATDGNFYGATANGGDLTCNTNGCGTVFRMAPRGTFKTLHSFHGRDGRAPTAGPIQATDGGLYGTTAGGGNLRCDAPIGCGTVFKIAPTGELTTLHSFCDPPCTTDGVYPYAGLIQATDGTFYGVTNEGGSLGDGTIFSLSTGLAPFVSFVRNPAKVGQSFGILGQGFTGTTSVAINGIQTDFNVVFDTFIRATVPAGATRGYVTVTTPSGTLTSNVPFHVIP
jgi:uncharacterized repeat protein (TIGR03803 family)